MNKSLTALHAVAAAALLLRAAGVEKGAADPKRSKVGKVSRAQVKEIAEKMFAGLDDETLYKVVRGNAIRMLGLDLD
mgnify:CR=1 FL=1